MCQISLPSCNTKILAMPALSKYIDEVYERKQSNSLNYLGFSWFKRGWNIALLVQPRLRSTDKS